jgi:site-specific recombinase XerD
MKPATSFPRLLRAFFYERLVEQRNCSIHTVRSYRDTWRLFLRFAADRHRRRVAELDFGQLGAAEVSAFLQHVEQVRHDKIGTRNCRLAALRSFFTFAAEREPTCVATAAEVLNIPFKRGPLPHAQHLELEEIDAVLAQPDRSTPEGQRDYVLLCFLYNTGARIEEALGVCQSAIRFESPACVRLFGKGRKERLCPLWPETAGLLRNLLVRCPRPPDEPLFVNRYGAPLGASGVRYKLAAYVAAASRAMPSLKDKHVTPHRFRHSVAVQLVAAGTDVTTIRSWLGHVRLDTTNRYAQATLETKRAALERLDPAMRKEKAVPVWRQDANVLDWLDSL